MSKTKAQGVHFIRVVTREGLSEVAWLNWDLRDEKEPASWVEEGFPAGKALKMPGGYWI